MFQVPFMAGDFETGVPPNAQPAMPMEMGMPVMGGAQPHVTFAGTIVALLALKFFTESNLFTFDVSEIKVSLHNIISITLQAAVGLVGIKVTLGYLLQRG